MKYLIFVMLLLIAGCATQTHTEYYADGKVKVHDERSGYTGWSAGEGKELPFSHISLMGM